MRACKAAVVVACLWLLALPERPAFGQTIDIGTSVAGDSAPQIVRRGKYLVMLSHCNNCHTAGYSAAEGRVSEDRWLLGNPVGWRGRNGTVYAVNLRLYFQGLSEDGWIQVARSIRARPPMPWWTLRDTSDADLRAMYSYIRSLTPLGAPAPSFLPPDQAPRPPYNQLPDISVSR